MKHSSVSEAAEAKAKSEQPKPASDQATHAEPAANKKEGE